MKAGGSDEAARKVMREAAGIIDRLAATIEEDDVRQRLTDGAAVEAGFAETSSPR